jgi:hypothetical protein
LKRKEEQLADEKGFKIRLCNCKEEEKRSVKNEGMKKNL